MTNDERIATGIAELKSARSHLAQSEADLVEGLKGRAEELRTREERVEIAKKAMATLLTNARAVYTTLVTRDVLYDRTILHEIRGEIEQIDEKLVQLRKL